MNIFFCFELQFFHNVCPVRLTTFVPLFVRRKIYRSLLGVLFISLIQISFLCARIHRSSHTRIQESIGGNRFGINIKMLQKYLIGYRSLKRKTRLQKLYLWVTWYIPEMLVEYLNIIRSIYNGFCNSKCIRLLGKMYTSVGTRLTKEIISGFWRFFATLLSAISSNNPLKSIWMFNEVFFLALNRGVFFRKQCNSSIIREDFRKVFKVQKKKNKA